MTYPPNHPQPMPDPAMPDPAMTSRQRQWLPVALVVAIVAAIVVVVIIVTSISGSADAGDYGLDEAAQQSAPDVSQLAADAAAAADDVDIEAGLALMCQAPSNEEVDQLQEFIAAANKQAGGEAEKSLTITEVQQDGATGTFVVQVLGKAELSAYSFTATAEVKQAGDGWCIDVVHLDD